MTQINDYISQIPKATQEAIKGTIKCSAATALGLSCLGVGGVTIAFFMLGLVSPEVLVAGILVGLFGTVMTTGGAIGLSVYPKMLHDLTWKTRAKNPSTDLKN